MIFSSLQYLIFLPIVVFLYWRTTGGARLALVVLASYIFYMSWLPVYGLLLLALTAINFGLALLIDKTRPPQIATVNSDGSPGKPKNPPYSTCKVIFFAAALLNLGCLFYYKYANFLIENVVNSYNAVALKLGSLPAFALYQPLPWDKPILDVILPLGISFFAFEFVHYLADVYKGDKPMRSFMEFAAFASFFPSQIAGPIKRYQDFTQKLRVPEQFSSALFMEGSVLIMQGLFKKVAIADPLGALIAGPFASAHALSAPDAWIAAFGFYIQVYCDFSGYTDIGRGSALWLGIRLPENFGLPFLTRDLSLFWRKWHMSLSSWLKDYIYIPLGGGRAGALLQWRNLFITMIACGLWHGASWHYIIFGAIQGFGLVINKEWKDLIARSQALTRIFESTAGHVFAYFLTQLFVIVTYSVFRSPDIPHSLNLLSSLFNFGEASTLTQAIEKSGVVYIASLYFLFWFMSDRLAQSPRAMAMLRPLGLTSDGQTFALPVKLASWTAACVLMFAAKPTETVPFVYFQF
ncbi:MAG: MBOAT family protein [Leptolyngbya sp.]|nr:MBOAT family protein [Candidatus Melainabacteria bacterium]